MRRTHILYGFAVAITVALGACRSTQTRFLHPNADLAAIKKVAVLPFENLTPEKSNGDKVQKIFFVELLSLETFDVVEPGQVTKVLRGERIESVEALGPADLKRIGEALGAQGLFIGTVVDYGEARTGATSAPQITIQLRLIETQSGATVWTTSQTRSGTSISNRLFGIGGDSLTEAARKLIRDELATMFK